MNNLKIKPVTLFDVDDLRQIAIKTFTETFADSNSEENMQQYLQESFDIQKLRSEINTVGVSFILALDESGIAGYLKTNIGISQTEIRDNRSLEIERIYVAKAYQGKGVGQMLFQAAVQKARNCNLSYIWLGVWEHNHKAIQFYSKNGFVPFDKHIFKLGNDEQTDILMKADIS